jgi:hypothetical protein
VGTRTVLDPEDRKHGIDQYKSQLEAKYLDRNAELELKNDDLQSKASDSSSSGRY